MNKTDIPPGAYFTKDLGADSIDVLEIVIHLRAEFKVDIDVS